MWGISSMADGQGRALGYGSIPYAPLVLHFSVLLLIGTRSIAGAFHLDKITTSVYMSIAYNKLKGRWEYGSGKGKTGISIYR